MLRSVALALALAVAIFEVSALNASQWKRRTTYQVVTDRFALGSNDKDLCGSDPDHLGEPRDCLWGAFCGGTFQGIVEKLDYIQGMGFDAIYISPVVKNLPCGYHGYWTENLWQIDPRFGGEDGLMRLMTEAHKRGIAIMLDTVFNHMGALHFTDMDQKTFHSDNSRLKAYAPFNLPDHFHGSIESHPQAQKEGINQDQREQGWIGFVDGECPDLNHEHPFVHEQLLAWIHHMVDHYKFDAVRVDAAPYVPKEFLQKLNNELPDTYVVGEVIVPNKGVAYAASYQFTPSSPVKPQGWNDWEWKWKMLDYNDPDIFSDKVTGTILDGVLNNPVLGLVRDAFATKDGTYTLNLEGFVYNMKALLEGYKHPGALPVFIDNHDNGRWFHYSPDHRTYKTGQTFVLFTIGVPIVYYGMEQGMVGPGGFGTNASRYPQWNHGYDQSSPLYKWTQRAILARKKALDSLPESRIDEMMDFWQTDSKVVSFSRGSALVVMSLLPKSDSEPCVRIHANIKGVTTVCDELEEDGVCLDVQPGGHICVPANGIPLVLFPKVSEVTPNELSSKHEAWSCLAALGAFVVVAIMTLRVVCKRKQGLAEPLLA